MRTSICCTVTVALLCMSFAQAQTTTTNNAVASFLSEAYSVYTEVTSILASDANAAASTPSSNSSSSTSASTSSTKSITSMSVSPSSRSTSSATLAAAASTSSSVPSSGSSGGHNTLAIVLGSVLGALALGLLLLVLVLICCHRRRKTRSHRALPLADEEVNSWRGNSGHGLQETGLLGTHATAGTDHSMAAAAAAAPDMAEHPAFRNSHENPFVPVPPPPRRTAPNSKVGLTDGTVPGQEPFISGAGNRLRSGTGSGGSLPTQGQYRDHHAGEALAAGAAGAALGAAAIHHHDRHRDGDSLSQKRYSGNRHSLTRKPVPDGSLTEDGSGAALLNQPSNSTALSPFNSAGHHRSHSQEALLAGGAATSAGALGGAAVADHHKQHGHDTDSGFFSNHAGRTSAPRAATPFVPPLMTTSHHQPNAMPPDYDLVPDNNDAYRNSRPISGIAPAAALGAHHRDRDYSPNNSRHARNSTPPAVPSRSPRRTRFSDAPYDPANQALTPPLGAISSIDRDSNNHSNSSGDSGFRLSSSIPGGWRRDSADSDHHLRNSGINHHGRRSNGSITNARDFATKDSGMSSIGTRPASGAGTRRHSPVINPGMGPSGRRHSQSPGDITSERVRLSDLRAEEEQMERERQRGRRHGGMRNEWAGGDGYDGYERASYGVGQAL